jgi:head-tail adaptor
MASRVRPDRCTILRKSTVSDGAGEEVDASWAPIAEDVACRIRPIGGGEDAAGDAVHDQTTHVVALGAGQDIDEPDRIKVGETLYDVTLVRRSGEQEIERRVEVREVP